VGVCLACNRDASLDEEYVACLLEVAKHGTVESESLDRRKVMRILNGKPSITARLSSALESGGQFSINDEDRIRISAVLEKIARSLWAYETAETAARSIASVYFAAIPGLAPDKFEAFIKLEGIEIFPEVGSRMMSRVLISSEGPIPPAWIEVQPGRFIYGVELLSGGGRVKMVLSDYLAVEVDLTPFN
jgi:hypothetical protein